jgi:preprotein translocase SecE subunit
MNYVKDSIEELKKATWPTKNQAVKLTIITIVFTILATLLLSVSDLVFKEGYQGLLNSSNKVQSQPVNVSQPTQPTAEDINVEDLGINLTDTEGNEINVDSNEE